MQVFYYQRRDRQPNFGDELNHWLWQRLIPTYLNPGDQTTALVGLGTLLNDALPERLQGFARAILFTTGAGYERPLRCIPDNWRIYAVRGPQSAQLLGLPETLAITDGGLLLRRCYTSDLPKQYRAAWMPHIHHANFAAPLFQQVCAELGIEYIDPRSPVETVLTQIARSEVLIAEAMHGAIAADALRVPWIPVVTSPRILPFKWRDWCASIGIPYQPHFLPPPTPYVPYARGLRSGLLSGIHYVGCIKSGFWPLASNPIKADNSQPMVLKKRLGMILQAEPQLSPKTVQNRLLDQLNQGLHRLCQDLDQDLD